MDKRFNYEQPDSDNPAAASMKMMTYVMSAMMLFWGFSFPAGLTLYWTIGNVFAIAQHYLIMNPLRAKLAVSKEEVVDEKPRNKK